ncbi:unnamed protein product [Symbiodinium sp. KB8]|nr:unnamed protein product [Symbiodinium sp. KB8]
MAALRRVARVKLPAHKTGHFHNLVAARVLDSTFWLQSVPSARCSSNAAPSGTAKTEPSGAVKPPSTESTTEKSQWVKAIDPANGLPFWYNKVTMEHRDKEPEFAKYDELKDSETPADVKLVRGTDGRMWESYRTQPPHDKPYWFHRPSGEATWKDPEVTPADALDIDDGKPGKTWQSIRAFFGFGGGDDAADEQPSASAASQPKPERRSQDALHEASPSQGKSSRIKPSNASPPNTPEQGKE